MHVREFMHTDVITIPGDTLITDAQKIMQDNGIHRLPVVDNGKLTGIVTRTKLRDVAPSPATSLSIWELNYLLSKIKVREVMETRVITTTPDATIEEAALLGAEHGVGALPVVEGDKLVGIITQSDLFRLLVDIIGVREGGCRIQIVEPYRDKPFGRVSEIVSRHRVRVLSVFTFTHPKTQRQDMVIRIATDDPKPIVDDLKEGGFEIEETY